MNEVRDITISIGALVTIDGISTTRFAPVDLSKVDFTNTDSVDDLKAACEQALPDAVISALVAGAAAVTEIEKGFYDSVK